MQLSTVMSRARSENCVSYAAVQAQSDEMWQGCSLGVTGGKITRCVTSTFTGNSQEGIYDVCYSCPVRRGLPKNIESGVHPQHNVTGK